MLPVPKSPTIVRRPELIDNHHPFSYIRTSTEHIRTFNPEAPMGTTRLDVRLDEKIKAKAEKASILLGMKSLTEYVVRLMDEDATKIIKAHDKIILSQDRFECFMTACENAEKPNQALQDAASFTKKLGIK